jgi:hypothetical protein
VDSWVVLQTSPWEEGQTGWGEDEDGSNGLAAFKKAFMVSSTLLCSGPNGGCASRCGTASNITFMLPVRQYVYSADATDELHSWVVLQTLIGRG